MDGVQKAVSGDCLLPAGASQGSALVRQHEDPSQGGTHFGSFLSLFAFWTHAAGGTLRKETVRVGVEPQVYIKSGCVGWLAGKADRDVA